MGPAYTPANLQRALLQVPPASDSQKGGAAPMLLSSICHERSARHGAVATQQRQRWVRLSSWLSQGPAGMSLQVNTHRCSHPLEKGLLHSIYDFALKWVKRCCLTVSSSLYACHGWQALPSAVGAQAGRRRRFCLIAPLMKAKIHLGQLLHGPCIPYRPCERSRVSPLFSWLLYRLQRFAEGSPALPICASLAVASSVATG